MTIVLITQSCISGEAYLLKKIGWGLVELDKLVRIILSLHWSSIKLNPPRFIKRNFNLAVFAMDIALAWMAFLSGPRII
jgi:hypothetical protein